jgi:hypothetical protein
MYKLLIFDANDNACYTKVFKNFHKELLEEFGCNVTWTDAESILKPRYDALLDEFYDNILFNSEEDMTFFVLTYS